MNFDQFFKVAFGPVAAGDLHPFDYQRRLACGDRNEHDEATWLVSGADCKSKLINIPTGCGKTAAVVLAWLWNRVEQKGSDWPRRFVFCLPMRTLVEQTRDNVRDWLSKRDFLWDGEGDHSGKVGLHILLGGEEWEENPWDLYPEHDAILIGTQDMLLSRALNRGYGMSRYRWPMHFGLLNRDCLWILDETQLMGVSVETSAQLDGFRKATDNCPTWWMSATIDRVQLNTVDHREPDGGWPSMVLGETDLVSPVVRKRIEARKTLTPAPFLLNAETKKDYAKRLAEFISARHQKDTLTLVVVNRVHRAQAIYSALVKGGVAKERLALIHSRFRPPDRAKHGQIVKAMGDRIVIATQAVEAGVDVSARLLITELAPWSSLVQRFGRCNRGNGDIFFDDAEVVWINVDASDEGLTSPYTARELNDAREALKHAGVDVGLASLQEINVSAPRVVRPVLRHKDLLDLFDTTPDLCGNDLDISRYIRDGDDTDVQVFWRDLPEGLLNEDIADPDRRELCRVSIADFTRFLGAKSKPKAFIWNAVDEHWQEAKRPRPGGVYLLALESGGYSGELGWTHEPDDKPTELPSEANKPEGYGSNRETFLGHWLSIHDHTSDVIAAMRALTSALSPAKEEIVALETAALWHDVGKAHPVFQKMLRNGSAPPNDGTIWAKSPSGKGSRARKGFRHELASALAWLIAAPADANERDLVAYLIAAHHGKVRLSIRALPNEQAPPDSPDRLHARGIWDGEDLPAIALPDGTIGPIKLDLSFMQMGDGTHGASWLSRVLTLRDRLGPFRLAYLETLLRVADMRASALESSNS
ncbi:MAG: CRISPR-associated helicase Cas3' [Chthoniobacterales bacterium]|nr:CRISPR-associated helicase Cas3' [Chthoniobacterales bacterium]